MTDKRPLPRRFYKLAIADQGTVLLDGRAVKTPLKQALHLPNSVLAEAIAAEWNAQVDVIDPARMPLTKLANTALDRATAERDNIIREIADYANADLTCYRAEKPPGLAAAQAALWDPVLAWALLTMDAPFDVVTGLMHRPQPPQSLKAVAAFAGRLDAFHLTAVYLLTTLTGSALLGLMLDTGAVEAEAAWAAAHVDEDHQIAEWGQDDEAQARRAARRVEYDGIVRFLGLAGG